MTEPAQKTLLALAENYPNGDYALSLMSRAGAGCVPCINAAIRELEEGHFIESSTPRYVGFIPRKHWRLTMAGYNLAFNLNHNRP